MKSNVFDPKRFGLLLRKECRANHRTLLIVMALVVAFLLFSANVYADDPDDGAAWFNKTWYPVILFLGGFLFTSVSFQEFVGDAQRQFYLNLPASNLEKFAGKWLITAGVFPIAYTLLYQILSLLIGAWVKHLYNFEFEILPLFGAFQRGYLQLYIVLQSIFLIGAIVFHRYAIVKTSFGLLLIGLALLASFYGCVRLLFPEYFDGFEVINPGPQLKEGFNDWIAGPFWTALQYAFYLLLWPVMLLIGYFKLKEKEV